MRGELWWWLGSWWGARVWRTLSEHGPCEDHLQVMDLAELTGGELRGMIQFFTYFYSCLVCGTPYIPHATPLRRHRIQKRASNPISHDRAILGGSRLEIRSTEFSCSP